MGCDMIRKNKYLIRLISVVLVLSFFFSEVAWAAPLEIGGVSPSQLQVLSNDPTRFEAPVQFAMLREIHSAKGGSASGGKGNQPVFIIHIQDAHVNLSGQQN